MTVEILLIHRVLPADRQPPGPGAAPTITPERLDALLAARADCERIAPDRLLEPDSEAPRLLVAADGGYRDFVDHALPVLERHGVHAVLFVVSDWAKGIRGPYENALGRALRTRARVEIPLEGFVPLDTAAQREQAFEALRRLYKPLPTAEREGLVAALGADPCEVEPGTFLAPEELHELATHPLVTLGSMGRTHAFLPRLRSERLAADIAQGKRELETWTGAPVEWFAYPHGAYNLGARRCVAAAGFRFACGADPGAFEIDRVDRLALPRTDVTHDMVATRRSAGIRV